MHIQQRIVCVKSRVKEMFLFILCCVSLHTHRALCNNAGLSWSYGKVLQRQLEL